MKLCTVCGVITSRAGSRCTEHARQSNRSRHNALYSTRAWQRLSARVLRAWRGEHGDWCPGYQRHAHPAADLTVDHVVPLAAGGLPFDIGNTAVLCRSCNSTKGSATDRGGVAHMEGRFPADRESEFGRLLTVMTREGSTLSPMVRDAWDGVPMGRVLARDQDIVPLHHVGVIAHVTPVELRQRLTSTDSANGFGNRFLWLAVRRTRLVPFPASPAERVPAAAITAIGAAIEEAQGPAEVTWSAAARDAWEDLYLALTLERRVGLYGSLVARAEAQVVRLALVYALLDRSPVVDAPHLAAATALWRYAERSAAHVFGRSTGNRHADALLRILRDGPLGREAAKRELGIRTAADLQDAIDLLRQIGAVETVRVARAGGGRPAEVLRLAGVTTDSAQTAQGPAQNRGPGDA